MLGGKDSQTASDPVIPEVGENTEEETAPKIEPQTHIEDMWMDFEEFCKCFK